VIILTSIQCCYLIDEEEMNNWCNSRQIIPKKVFFARVCGDSYPIYNNLPAMLCQERSVYFHPTIVDMCPNLSFIREEAESECPDMIQALRKFYKSRSNSMDNEVPPFHIQYMLYRVYIDSAKKLLGTMIAPDNRSLFSGGV
jgi:uncharacterized protein YbaR (Trm112 family)